MAPVIHELQKRKFEYKVCVTAQHREMLDQVLDFFEIIPDYDLNLMKAGQSLNSLSALILQKIDEVLKDSKPDIVLVQGDTTTAFLAALSAFYREIKVGHIEAGLRTQNLHSPFPEEGNRQLISRITDYHFAPTLSARNNLLKESISTEKIIVTGNTVIDSLLTGKSRLENGYRNSEIEDLEVLIDKNKKLILVTGHRRENFGKGLEEVCRALLKIGEREDVQIIFPVHLNPAVKKPVFELLGSHSNINLIEPVNYPAFIWLMIKARFIISDSGGIQEEAPSLGKAVLITRNTTERPEGVKKGFSFLVGTSTERILEEAFRVLDTPLDYSKLDNPFGDGKAAERIVEELVKMKT
ncbi:MAG: non-hydrolyzing UDP-N-acetylglucosamine 2-epimerase [Bacteroidota bacterium]